MDNQVRVAQTELECDECRKEIRPCHKYMWKHDEKHGVIRITRVCIDCGGKGDK